MHRLEEVLGGNLDGLIEALQAAEKKEKLEAAHGDEAGA
jgi:hypothetical protein